MRVLHVDPERGWGGGEVQVLALAGELRARGHRCVVAGHPGGRLEQAARQMGLETVSLAVRNHLDLAAGMRLRRLARDVDVVHFHTARAHALAPALIGVPGRRVVTRRMDYVPRGGPYVRLLYGRLMDAVIAISEGVATALRTGGVVRDRIHVVPSAVDVARVTAEPGARERQRAAWNVSDGQVLVLSLGVLERRKGHDLVIDAAARLAATHRDLVAVIVGAGTQHEALAARIHAQGAPVRMVGFQEDVAPALAAADIVVLASRAEGLGVAALEALAAARPVVATRVGGLAEVVVDGETGLLVPPEDVGALGDALARLIVSPSTRERLGRAGQERVMARHSVAAMADRTLACYGGAP